MPFTKTEVDIHEDYTLEAVDPAWLAQGVKSPKHLMLDPDNCILCRACEDVCPWNCIYMLAPGIVEGTETPAAEAEVVGSTAIFIVDDNACTRARCASTGATGRTPCYYARLPEGPAATDDGRGAGVPGGGGMIVPTARGNALKLKPPSPSELGDRLRESEVWKSIFRPARSSGRATRTRRGTARSRR